MILPHQDVHFYDLSRVVNRHETELRKGDTTILFNIHILKFRLLF